MLDALSSVGDVHYESPLSNGKRPDFGVSVNTGGAHKLEIVGDIKTVSDSGIDKKNPVSFFRDELTRLAVRAGLNANHFDCRVDGGQEGPYGDGRIKLYLPLKGELSVFLRRETGPWLAEVKGSHNKKHCFDYDEGEIRFSITYDPEQVYASSGYLSYKVAASRSKNPLFNALKSKIGQLKNAPDTALKLIIACDGGCSLLHQPQYGQTGGNYSAREVAEDFLRQNSTVHAVLLVTIHGEREVLQTTTTFTMKYDLVIAPARSRSQKMDTATICQLENVLRRMITKVPQPVQAAYNAVLRCKEPGFGLGMLGGYKMSNDTVSLSSRALQQLLAGGMTVEEFIAAHRWDRPVGPSNPFLRTLQSGRMIADIEVERDDKADDDWLTFRFSGPDPAISPIRVPTPQTNQS